MKIKLDIIDGNILLFKFKNMKEISLTFFRAQEYYESQSDNFLNKKFSVFDFLKENMDKNGFVDYFNMWEGYNIPGHIFNEWISLFKFDELTEFEQELYHLVREYGPREGAFYIIAALEKDKNTIDHELAHALFYLNTIYRQDVLELNSKLSREFSDNEKRLIEYLDHLGYNKNVYGDEIQAYLSTEKNARLKDTDDFALKCTKAFLEHVGKYRNCLKMYKEQLDNRVVNVL